MNEQPTVGPDPHGVTRCPSCRARAGAAQDWCTLCHARLDAAPRDAATRDAGPSAPGPPAVLPPGVAEAMLAELAAATDRLPGGGSLAGRGRGVRTALAVAAAVVLALLGVGLLSLVGLLL